MERFYYQLDARDRLVWADNFKYELNVVDKDGAPLGKITRAAVPEALTRAALIKLFKKRMPGRQLPDALDIPKHFPKTLPFLNAIVCDDEGRIYVRTYGQYDLGRRVYNVFDKEGLLASRMVLPENEEIKAVKNGKVYVMIK